MGVGALEFLLGRWSGEGTVRGSPVTTTSEAASMGAGLLRLDVETRDGAGALLHRERVLFRGEADGGAAATTSPWRGGVQLWRVAEEEVGRLFILTSGGGAGERRFRWLIVRTGENTYRETFSIAEPGAAFENVVDLTHRREGPA